MYVEEMLSPKWADLATDRRTWSTCVRHGELYVEKVDDLDNFGCEASKFHP